MNNTLLHIVFFLVAVCGACAQQPQTIKLTQLETAPNVESSRAGQIGLTDASGKQRYQQYTEIEPTPVAFTPTPTGNVTNLSEFVTDPAGDVYYIDWQGRGLLIKINPADDKNGYYGGNGGNGGDATIPSSTISTLTNQLTWTIEESPLGGTVPLRVVVENETDFADFISMREGADSMLLYNSDDNFGIFTNVDFQTTAQNVQLNSTVNTILDAGGIIELRADSLKFSVVPTASASEHTFLKLSTVGFAKKSVGISYADLVQALKDSISSRPNIYNSNGGIPDAAVRQVHVGAAADLVFTYEDGGGALDIFGGSSPGAAGGYVFINSPNDDNYFEVTDNGVLISAARFSVTAETQLREASPLRFYDSNNSNIISIIPPMAASLTSDYTLTLPTSDGAAGEFLQTDGTGALAWAAAGIGDVRQNGNSFGATMTIGTNDNNIFNVETNGGQKLSVSTGGVFTYDNTTANTTTVQDVSISRIASSGTPGVGFGMGMLFQGESSTTANRDMVRLTADWGTVADATRTSRYLIGLVNSGAALVDQFAFTNLGLSVASSAGASPVILSNTALTPGANFTLGGSSNTMTLSSSSSSTSAMIISASNTAASVTFNNVTNAPTSVVRNSVQIGNGFNPTSGTAPFNAFRFYGTINQTGGANGATSFINDEVTVTAAADYVSFRTPVNCATCKGVYQSGATSTNAFAGKTSIGSTVAPVEALDITGNLSLTTAGNKLKIATGSNASVGTATLVGGTVTVNTTAVATGSIIFPVHNTPGGTIGILSAPGGSIVNGTSFVINSSSVLDTSTVTWIIIN